MRNSISPFCGKLCQGRAFTRATYSSSTSFQFQWEKPWERCWFIIGGHFAFSCIVSKYVRKHQSRVSEPLSEKPSLFPLVPSYIFTDDTAKTKLPPIIRELKHARFWDADGQPRSQGFFPGLGAIRPQAREKALGTRLADGNRKWAVLTFNLPSHSYIHFAKYLFSITDE